MFSDRPIPWVASIDAPGNSIDAYIETFQIHRHDLSRNFDRDDDVLGNLRSFADYWSGAEADDEAVLFVVDASTDGALDLQAVAQALPPRTSLVALVRSYRSIEDERLHVVGIPTDDPKEFANRVGGHLSRFMRMQPPGSPFKPAKSEFPGGRWEFDSLSAYEPHIGDGGHVVINADGIKYEFLTQLDPDSKVLIVFGQSALVRSTVQLPIFQRWSWAQDIPGASYISVNDPNMYLDETLNAGWWFGTSSRDTVREFAGIVARAAEKLSLRPEQIVFTGGSAGGFSSFQMAACLPGSRVVVDIPQIDMRAYSLQGEANNAARVAFGVDSIQDVPDDLLHRVDVTHRFRLEQHIPDYLYLQNLRDTTHILRHFQYFMDSTLRMSHDHKWALHKAEIELYSAWNVNRGGHFPLNRADTMERIRRFMEWRVAPGAPPRIGWLQP